MRNMFAVFALLAGVLVACQEKQPGTIYKDDDGNFLNFRCDTNPVCANDRRGLVIEDTANDISNPGHPDATRTRSYIFCCDTLKSIIDSLSKYAKLITACNAQYKGTKIGADDERPETDYPRELYFSDSNHITLAVNWRAEGDSLVFDGLQLDIGHKGAKVGLGFKSEKTLQAFADSLQNAHITCCF